MFLAAVVKIISFLPILIAIVLHEVAHGYAAWKLGDNTAKYYGRLSLNPLKHIDLFGTIILPALLIISHAGFVLGWAKPVPVNFNNLRNRRRDTVIVSAAGVITNLLLALVSAFLLRLTGSISGILPQGLISLFLLNMVVYNIVLAVFNILPLPPLDGSKILFGWSEQPWAQKYVNADRTGLAAIVFLVFIIPAAGTVFGYNWNWFGAYLVGVSKLLISALLM